MKKINLKVAVKELSRRELKIMMAGSGSGGAICPTVTCTSQQICSSLSGYSGLCLCNGYGALGICEQHRG